MANSGSFNTNAYEARYLTFEWSVASQNVATNQTVINWKLRGNGTNPTIWYMSGNFKVVINGSTVYQSETRIQLTGTTTVSSGQFTITHESDGNKTFSASVEAGIYYYAVNSRGSGTWALPMIARATQPTLNKTTMAFGDSIVISCPRASTQFTHAILASVVDKLTFTSIGVNVGTSHTWTLPKAWAKYLTHSTDKLKITVLTYSGSTLVGMKDAPLITVTATSDMAPVVNVTLSDPNNHYNTYGGFVKGKSKIKAVVTETMYEQAVVTSRSLILNDITYQSNNQTSEVIANVTQKVTASVTDSRGLIGTKTVTPIVYDWYEPKITQAKASRCQADGTLDESGNYIKLEYACAIAPVNNKNTRSLGYSFRKQGAAEPALTAISMTAYSKTGSVIFPASGENTWEVTVQLKDAFTTSKVVLSVGTAFVLLDFHSSGKGIGVGKVSEKSAVLDISPNWDIGYKNATIADFIESQGTTDGWIWRKWNSGIAECFRKLSISVGVKTPWGSLFTTGAMSVTNLTFPFEFKEIPIVSVSMSTNGWMGMLAQPGGSSRATTKTSGSFEIVRATTAETAHYFLNYSVIGRWK